MGNKCGHKQEDPDSAWKQQNKEQERNPMYQYVNLNGGSKLVDAYNDGGVQAVEKIAKKELPAFLYNDGDGAVISKLDYIKWQRRCEALLTVSVVLCNYFGFLL